MVRLEVITGPMFSGKSEELIKRLRRASYAKKDILVVKPVIDNRFEDDQIASREIDNSSGNFKKALSFPAYPINEAGDLYMLMNKHHPDVLALDEAQFFGNWIIQTISHLLKNWTLHTPQKDNLIIISGLDMDYKCLPWEPMPSLMAIADDVLKQPAVCFNCGSPNGVYTQRLTNSTEKVVVDDPNKRIYEARCRECHYIPS